MKRIQQTLPAVAAIFSASIVLGVAYNTASPLGVRGSRAAAVAASESPTPAAAAPAAAFPVPPVTSPPAAPNTAAPVAAAPVNPPAAPSEGAPPAARPQVKSLTWVEVKPLLEAKKAVLIDARPAGSYEADHIPGAVSLPATSTAAEIDAVIARRGKEMLYVVYCGSGQCGLSKMMAETLLNHGCQQVNTMPGGYAEYRLAADQAK